MSPSRSACAESAEDLDRLSPLDDATAERILRLEAADEDDVVLVLHAVLQVVENPPAFAHAGRRDYYHRAGRVVERHRLLGRSDERHARVLERILPLGKHSLRLVVVDLAVLRVDARRLLGKRRVDVDLDLARDLASLAELVQVVDDLLRAPDGKRRDEQFRVVAIDVLEVALEPQLDVVGARVELVGVSRLDDQDVGAGRIFVVAEYRLVRLAEVAREKQSVVVAVVGSDVELNERRTENVTSIEKLKRYSAAYLARRVHVRRNKELHQRIDVAFLVKRLKWLLAFLATLLVDVLEVALLEKARVAQHHVAQVGRGLPCEHASAKALPDELRQVAAVVDVRVGEDHVVDLRGIDWEVPVLFERLLAVALVQPAVEQYPLAVRFYKMHGASRRLRRPVESYSHAMIIPKNGRSIYNLDRPFF